MPIHVRMQQCQTHLPALLKRYLPPVSPDMPLFSAMHYACLNGGKRLRPLLAYCSAEIFGAPWQIVDEIAVAIEFIHCYSLIHDDLPAMDNDDLRRGKPTCHKVYGDALAILAGDALLTLAFDVLSSQSTNFIKVISQAAGAHGMVKGQAIDLSAQHKSLTLEQITQMHHAKTGRLIAASVQCGALATGHATEDDLTELQKFGEAIGLSFQIQDDILDTLGQTDVMGKHPGQDAKQEKCTFVSLLGLEKARAHAHACHQKALASLQRFDQRADPLRALSAYIIERVA